MCQGLLDRRRVGAVRHCAGQGRIDRVLTAETITDPSDERIGDYRALTDEIFPAFILLARVIVQARLVARAYFYFGLTLQGALTVFYLNGGWIA
jgi:hypothetical protein